MQADRTITGVIESLGELAGYFSFGYVGKDQTDSKIIIKAETPQQISKLQDLLKKSNISWVEEDGVLKQATHQGLYSNCLRGCSLAQ
jgi:hypothetical protein